MWVWYMIPGTDIIIEKYMLFISIYIQIYLLSDGCARGHRRWIPDLGDHPGSDFSPSA